MNGNEENKDILSNLEVTTFLKEEGFYDPLLSHQEMLELYQAVSNSKNTASAEDEKRRILEESKQDCDTIDELRLNSVPLTGDNLNTSSSSKYDESSCSKGASPSTPVSQKDFDDLDVFNSVPTNHPPLPRISYIPKYNPPLYCNPKINCLGFEEKIKVIAAYHKKLIKIYDTFQRKSLNYAPLGKPIQSDPTFNGSLLKNENKSKAYDFEEYKTYEQSQDDNSNDIYTLRSGRQTKRKLYFENRGEDKKSKSSEISKPQIKKKVDFDVSLDDTKSPKLFEHSKSRSEKLFDNLVEMKKKQDEHQKVNESFLKSLEVLSDEDVSKEVDDIQVEEPFIRRRVVPPSRGRGQKIKNNRSNAKTKKNSNKKQSPKENMYESLQTDAANISPTARQDDDFGTCPICSLHFPKDKLESHADQCIDLYEKRTSPVCSSKITCEKCDLVLPLTMDYELHVRECLTKSSNAT